MQIKSIPYIIVYIIIILIIIILQFKYLIKIMHPRYFMQNYAKIMQVYFIN